MASPSDVESDSERSGQGGANQREASGAEPPAKAGRACWVAVARIVKTQGHKGELAADLLTDIPGRFDQLTEIWLRPTRGERRAFTLVRHWMHQGRVVLKFAGIDDMTEAATWRGATVEIPRGQRALAPAGSFFISDLEGCAVLDQGRELGRVSAVEEVPGAAPMLHVQSEGGAELLIPFVAAYIERVDLEHHRLELSLPVGLTAINLPE